MPLRLFGPIDLGFCGVFSSVRDYYYFWVVRYSMMDTYSDGLGGLDFERSQHGSGMSKKAQAKKFISVLNRKAAESYRRYRRNVTLRLFSSFFTSSSSSSSSSLPTASSLPSASSTATPTPTLDERRVSTGGVLFTLLAWAVVVGAWVHIRPHFSIFSLAELRTTHQQLGLQTGNFMEFIDSLNNQGYLLKKGGRSYQLQTSDY